LDGDEKNIPLENDKPKHPISASTLKPIVDQYKQQKKPFNLGMTFPTGTHNYMLRYWLAAGGINPGKYDPNKNDFSGNIDADKSSVVPPPEMMAKMVAGTTLGYAVGEPWNQKAVKKALVFQSLLQMYYGKTAQIKSLVSKYICKNPNTTSKLLKHSFVHQLVR
jgi:nitrate/nitrite transport system substrate-binding protein